jgi:hypothetical protein
MKARDTQIDMDVQDLVQQIRRERLGADYNLAPPSPNPVPLVDAYKDWRRAIRRNGGAPVPFSPDFGTRPDRDFDYGRQFLKDVMAPHKTVRWEPRDKWGVTWADRERAEKSNTARGGWLRALASIFPLKD